MYYSHHNVMAFGPKSSDGKGHYRWTCRKGAERQCGVLRIMLSSQGSTRPMDNSRCQDVRATSDAAVLMDDLTDHRGAFHPVFFLRRGRVRFEMCVVL
jgi:hypothetical protein